MHDMRDLRLQEAVSRIVQAEDPLRVVLFGSRATGTANDESDYDLLVIKDSQEPRHQRADALRRLLRGLLPSLDILVYTPEEVDSWSGVPSAFVTQALREGITLYEKGQDRSRPGMDAQR